MNKLSHKDIAMLEVLAVTQESKGKLAEYIQQQKKAADAYEAFCEAVVSGFEVQTDSELPRMINSLLTVGEVTGVIEYKNGVPSRYVSDEVKRKFKAGDKVRVLDKSFLAASSRLGVGDITEVIGYKDDLKECVKFNREKRPVVVSDSCDRDYMGFFEESALELIEEKTPNELRAEVIEKAKEVLVEWKWKNNLRHDGYRNSELPNPYHNWIMVAEFVINPEKRTVVALLKCRETLRLATSGIAKCHPDDVFNADIGKAIALGRALGKDVSEFENAVQPSELVVGMVIRRNYFNSTATYEEEIEKVEGEVLYYAGGSYDLRISDTDNLTIIDDTNAQYGGVE